MLKPDAFVHDTSTSMPRVQPVEGVPTRIDVAFTNKSGVEKKGIRKEAERKLKQLAPALMRLLSADEFVMYLAGSCSPMSCLEQYTFGYFSQFVSRVTLVFTNKRILAFRVDTKGRWRGNLRGCALGDVKSAKGTGWLLRCLKLQYANGKRESYWAMKSSDQAKLKVILPKLLEANAGSQTAAQAMKPLCPTCFTVLVEQQYECAGCGQKFRGEESLWWRTFIPGGAYFYARQTGMGVLHAFVDTIIMFELLVAVFAPLEPGDTRENFVVGAGIVAFVLLLERSIALWHARRFVREFIPIEGTTKVQAAGAGR